MKTPEHSAKSFGDLSEEIFVRASVKYSTSVPAQGMYISLECRKYGLDLNDMLFELQNPERLERLGEMANKSHKHLPEDRKPNVQAKRVLDIVINDIHIAMRVHPIPSQLVQDMLDKSWKQHTANVQNVSQIERAEIDYYYNQSIINWAFKAREDVRKAKEREQFRRDYPILGRIRDIFSQK